MTEHSRRDTLRGIGSAAAGLGVVGSVAEPVAAQETPLIQGYGDEEDPDRTWSVGKVHPKDYDPGLPEIYSFLTLRWYGAEADAPYYKHEFGVFVNHFAVHDGSLDTALRSANLEITTNAHGSDDITRCFMYNSEDYHANFPRLEVLPEDFSAPRWAEPVAEAGIEFFEEWAGTVLSFKDIAESLSPKGKWTEKEPGVHWKHSHGVSSINPTRLAKVGFLSRFGVKVPMDADHASVNLEHWTDVYSDGANSFQNLHVDFRGADSPDPYSYTYAPADGTLQEYDVLGPIPVDDVDGATPQHLTAREANVPAEYAQNGKFVDFNGNGKLDSDDIVTYFNAKDSSATNGHVDAYDVNGNGKLDYDDVVKLFDQI